jgi:hypothetical protein
LPQFGFGHVGDVLESNDDPATVGLYEAHDVVEGHRFAYTATSNDGYGLARIDIKIGID